MNKYQGLLTTIANELHIECGEAEHNDNWKARIVYSLLGRMAYASLSDHLEENEVIPEESESVSITHFKQRIRVLLDSYLTLYPEISPLFETAKAELCNEIYDVYLKAGCIYHTPYEVLQSSPCISKQGDLQFERGMPLDRQQCISGLGSYLPNGSSFDGVKVYSSVQEMFGLQPDTLYDFWTDLLSHANWQPLHTNEDMEYLPYQPPLYRWIATPQKNGVASVSRIGQPGRGNYLYYLYKMENGQMLGSQLPQWLTDDPLYGGSSYRAVSNACLAVSSSLPAIKYHIDGPIVKMRLQYLLPPAELYWVKLYSWPSSFYNVRSNFERVFSQPVFGAVNAILEQIGYQFVEE